jgi:rubredoxin
MAVYRCDVCNVYEYDDSKGDADKGIAPGTNPQDFPENWTCPICSSDKTHLQPV